MLDLDYKGPMADILKLIRKQPSLPSKQADTKIVIETTKKQRVTEMRMFTSSSSILFLR